MVDRKLQRRPLLDPAVAELLSGMEQRQAESQLPQRERKKKARERAKIQARREQRVTYDLPPELRQRIQKMAELERLPASQIVTLALKRFLQDHAEGKVDLSIYKQPSRSPRYDWNLVFEDEAPPPAAPSPRRKKQAL
jgi:hypothetical protein